MFHTPVDSVCFIMDKSFYHMEHDDTERKDLFQVMETFSKVSDGKMVGPVFKTMKRLFLHGLRVDLFSEKTHFFFIFFQKKGLPP